jgi:hypothetical protein
MKMLGAAFSIVLLQTLAHAQNVTWIDGIGWRRYCEDTSCFTTVPIGYYAEGDTILDVFSDCGNSETCGGMVDAIGALFDVPPGTISGMLRGFHQGYEATTEDDGNEHWIYVDAKPGYRFCNMYWSVEYLRASGQSAPSISGTIYNRGRRVVFYSAVTPGGLDDDAWLSALVKLHSVREEDYPPRSKCQEPIATTEKGGSVIFNTNAGSRLEGGRHACHKREGACAS